MNLIILQNNQKIWETTINFLTKEMKIDLDRNIKIIRHYVHTIDLSEIKNIKTFDL